MNKVKCECPLLQVANPIMDQFYLPEEQKARNHAPNECEGDFDLIMYWRKGNYIWLCSACNLPGDVAVEDSIVAGMVQ